MFLQRLWKTIQTKAKTATAPTLVYEEAELPLRIVRDLFAGDFVGAQIDDDRTHRRIVSYLKKTSPHMVERVHRYREKAPLFEASGVDAEIRSTLDRRVDLPVRRLPRLRLRGGVHRHRRQHRAGSSARAARALRDASRTRSSRTTSRP